MSTDAGAGAGAAGGAAGAGAGAGAAGGAAAGGAAAPWYGDKVDDVTVGFWKNKGIDPADPVAVATKLTEFYRGAEKHIGAPPEKMLRLLEPNAPEPDIKAFWNKVGVPVEATEYDLSAVKFSDGKELDSGFVDTFRAAAHAARVPKDMAPGLLSAMVKVRESENTAALASRTAIIKEQQTALDKNWGTNKNYNMEVAQRALMTLGQSAGLTPEQTRAGWDAISSGNHIGGAYAMEMLLTYARKTGEAPFVGAQPGQGGNNQVLSAAQAKAEIETLKVDTGFYAKLMKKDAEATRRWSELHKIAYAA